MRPAIVALRLALAVALGVCLWAAAEAKAAAVEYLMVPSAAMGRDTPVAFQGGGPHDPSVHAGLLVNNGTRVWVFSPSTVTCSDPAAMIGYCDQAQGSNRSFFAQYRAVGGSNAHVDIPVGGRHDWSSWGPQLVAMSGDLTATLR